MLKARLLLFLFCVSLQINAQHTTRKSFNEGWKFKLDSIQTYSNTGYNDDSWRRLNLPHDWSIEGSFSKDHPATPGGGALPGGIGWYRKTFTLPLSDKNKLIFIDFDGVYCNSEVWINGHSLGIRPNGYISFQYELTPYLKYGYEKNIIAVKADNSKQPNSRWYSGSGIYRNVWLTVSDQLHVDQWGTFVTTPKVTNQSATVHITTKIKNQYKSELPFILKTTIYTREGKQVAIKDAKGKAGKDGVVSIDQSLSVTNPHLWSTEDPYLYQTVSEVVLNGKTVDVYRTPLGIRDFHFDVNKGFFLNGKPMKIMGVCNHHDLGALGAAINTRALERQLEILKAMGCNGIRTSHNPPAPELLELCDRMGFIVMDEAFDIWAKHKNPFDYHLDWDQWHKKDLEDLILRDRNHPSVFIWSVGNEIQEQWGDASKGDTTGRGIARELVAIVKSLDTTRAITTANNETNPSNNLIQSGAFEMIGYNYNHQKWSSFPKDYPGKKFIVTESTSALQTRGHYDNIPFDTIRRWPEAWDKPIKGGGNPDFTVSAYDHVSAPWGSTHEESIKELIKNGHVSGMYVWTGFDYLGEPTPYPWPARSSYFGIIDLAGFPKDVYYLYQSQFINKPVLHLYPHWNWKVGDTVDVVAYYNHADEVELFLNGQSLGSRRKMGDTLHVKWRLPFTPGTLKATSRKDGKTVLSKEVKTAGAPAKIVLKADRKQIKGNGKDLSFITATIVDKDGVMVPQAKNLIRFSVNGTGFINAVDNGDPTSHEPFKSNMRKAFNGLALAILQSNGKEGKIVLTAHADGLEEGTVEVNAD
jgi:beta-galactosidase